MNTSFEVNSPFPYEHLAGLDSFYGRKEEIAQIETILSSGNNLLLFSKRRMGKTTLVRRVLEKNRERYLGIYVDIFDVTSKEELAHQLLKGVTNAQKGDLKTALKKITGLFRRVRVEPTIDPESLEYSLKPVVATLTFEEMMEDFFASLKALATEQPVVLAIDEFQQIAGLGKARIDAYLRKEIQGWKNISCIFLGSKRHLLTSLFRYQAPLYEMATSMELPPLALDEIYGYTGRHLDISRGVMEHLCTAADYETKLIQHACHNLYMACRKEIPIDKNMVDETIAQIVRSKSSGFIMLYDTLSNNQKTALKIAAKYKKGFFAAPVLQEYRIKKQTLQSALDALYGKELIDRDGEVTYVPDRTLELWLQRL